MVKLNARNALSGNLKVLMMQNELDQKGMAKKADTSQKTISNAVTASFSASIDTLDKIATALSVESWELLIDNVPSVMIGTRRISKLVKSYISASPESRAYIDSILEKETPKD